MIAPFSKKPMNVTLKGITTDDQDLSVCTNVRLENDSSNYRNATNR